MDVRVCGPNLNDQSKGTFHVHADGCPDLRKYGPQYHGKDAKGGDLNGNREMLIADATIYKVAEEVYADHIQEQPENERAAYVDNLISDFYFAPCCRQWLLYGTNSFADGIRNEIVTGQITWLVYECWTKEPGSFVKFADPTSPDGVVGDVAQWLRDQLLKPGSGKGQHINIGVHSSDEYSN